MGIYDSFSVLVLLKVRENSWNLSTFSLLVEKQNHKNPRSFLYRFDQTKFVLILSCSSIFRGISCCNDLCVMWQIGWQEIAAVAESMAQKHYFNYQQQVLTCDGNEKCSEVNAFFHRTVQFLMRYMFITSHVWAVNYASEQQCFNLF